MAEAKQHNRGKKLIKDFGTYSIGVLGSNIITFLMFPLYTYFVKKPSDYGYFDTCLQMCMLLIPIVTLQLRDGAFRFLLETPDKVERSRIVTFVYRTILHTTLLVTLIAFFISLFHPIRYLWYIITLLIIMSIYEVLIQVIRGLGNNKTFVSAGIITSFGIGLFSLVFVAGFKLGVLGIFLANIVARIVSIAIVEYRMKTLKHYFNSKIDWTIISRDLIKYSLPLIPVTLCSLLPPMSDRLFINFFIGLEETGNYALAVRLSGIIHSISIIFYQTWQENGIQQYNSPDRDAFFSRVFNGYIFVLSTVLIGYIFIIKMCYPLFIAPNYQSSLRYLLPVGISWVMIAISNYFYIPYQCVKDTKSATPSVVILAVTNITLNFILVPFIGVFGVIVTSIIAYTFVTLYLWSNTKRMIKLHFYPNTIIPLFVILISFFPFYNNKNIFADILFIIIATLVNYIASPKDIKIKLLKIIKKATFKKVT